MESRASEKATIASILDSVTRRLRLRNVLNTASIGLAVGCFATAMLACVSVAITPIAWPWFPALIVVSTLAAGLVGLAMPVSAVQSAHLVDSFYHLKDRAITGLQFRKDSDPLRRMQADDALRHMDQVRADDCVAIEANRPALASATMMAALAAMVMLLAPSGAEESIGATPVKLAVDQATELRETMLQELEAIKEQVDEPELDELTQKLEELIEELATESIDERDMMATLSEMESAIQSAQEAMQLEMTDAQMQSLAAAIEPSEAMKQAAAAMKNGDYESAASKLENVDPANLSDNERRAVADNLKKFMAKLPSGQQGKLSGAAELMQAGLESKNLSQCKDGMCKLAGLCKKQGQCKKIGECMACQLYALSQCKSDCRGACKDGGSKVAKSNSPSQKWGKGATGAGNDGEATRLDSQRNEEQLSGLQGDGPSESEVIEAPEGEQDAVRQYAARYQKFRSQAEAVLDNEPLPLGHRQTVRQYFESIRPDTGE